MLMDKLPHALYSRNLADAKRLKIVLQGFELPARPISMAVPQDRMLPARSRVLMEFIRSDLAKLRSAALGVGRLDETQRSRRV